MWCLLGQRHTYTENLSGKRERERKEDGAITDSKTGEG